VSAFQSYGEKVYDRITEEERKEIVRNSCPGPGACGGMYTANTMATAIEAMGMSLPYSSSTPADDEVTAQFNQFEFDSASITDKPYDFALQLKRTECKLAGDAIRNLLKKDIKPRYHRHLMQHVYS